ncbi:MAG: HAEPLYID family protein [Bacteroidota bacterium]
MKRILYLILFLFPFRAYTQHQVPKISHAEPVYFDLVRDLGARKGEKELNLGAGFYSDQGKYSSAYLVEYEFAPVNRLGVEVEIPFSFSRMSPGDDEKNASRIKGIEAFKVATQYSFLVAPKAQITMAIGYMLESERKASDLMHCDGFVHTPFLVIAKKWGNYFHTMIYSGPQLECARSGRQQNTLLVNSSVHWVIPGSRNFVGMELNQEVTSHATYSTFRPQVKLFLSSTSALGIAIGIPVSNGGQNMDVLFRWIYEPQNKK